MNQNRSLQSPRPTDKRNLRGVGGRVGNFLNIFLHFSGFLGYHKHCVFKISWDLKKKKKRRRWGQRERKKKIVSKQTIHFVVPSEKRRITDYTLNLSGYRSFSNENIFRGLHSSQVVRRKGRKAGGQHRSRAVIGSM